MSRPTLPDTASQGDTGHVADHNTIVDALTELYGEHSEGAGTPEGTVTATPGRTYADTTAGDLWVKNTGTGNTGWQSLPRVTAVDATTGRLAIGGIEMGDTGWRNVSSLLVNGWTATALLLRRVGSTVYLHAATLSGVSATSDQFVSNLGAGFTRPSTSLGHSDVFATNNSGTSSVFRVSLSGGLFTAYRSAAAAPNFEWITSDAWPATLPGTPA